jgi:hypothetical protein
MAFGVVLLHIMYTIACALCFSFSKYELQKSGFLLHLRGFPPPALRSDVLDDSLPWDAITLNLCTKVS